MIIIGILAAIAIPAYLAERDDARQAVTNSDARQAGTALNACLLEQPAAANCDELAELDAYGYNKSDAVTFAGAVQGDGSVTTTHTFTGTAINTTHNSGTGNITP